MDKITELQATILKALANPTRLEILHALANGPVGVGRMAEALGLTQPNVSQHLAVLRGQGIVATRRDGASVLYSIADTRLNNLLDDASLVEPDLQPIRRGGAITR